jgi:hypothetical protein
LSIRVERALPAPHRRQAGKPALRKTEAFLPLGYGQDGCHDALGDQDTTYSRGEKLASPSVVLTLMQ